eukprot:CAMPEP_0196665114 /NCGR_PEP_ID=MMETSP1086-20130531/59674_1 /TAXON_ID=77921 /ORGANISM="Cyanoptyche  gloeocystis , Strain SAG4.97" /LENGTH=201 /DNA_ID=CAMNT_0042001711 /DNA_START=191 /DNA_END=796 /DNA_ORIENTATION=+
MSVLYSGEALKPEHQTYGNCSFGDEGLIASLVEYECDNVVSGSRIMYDVESLRGDKLRVVVVSTEDDSYVLNPSSNTESSSLAGSFFIVNSFPQNYVIRVVSMNLIHSAHIRLQASVVPPHELAQESYQQLRNNVITATELLRTFQPNFFAALKYVALSALVVALLCIWFLRRVTIATTSEPLERADRERPSLSYGTYADV